MLHFHTLIPTIHRKTIKIDKNNNKLFRTNME